MISAFESALRIELRATTTRFEREPHDSRRVLQKTRQIFFHFFLVIKPRGRRPARGLKARRASDRSRAAILVTVAARLAGSSNVAHVGTSPS